MARRNRKKVFEKVEVVDTANRGKAVAKTGDGQVIFLNHAVPGDVVDIETYKKRRSFYEGRVTKYHRFSEKRTEPKCEHFGICGGCKWQNMSYDAQLEFKQKEVENNLKRIGQVDIPEILQIIPSPDIFYYRNKMEFSFSDNRWLSTEELNSSVQFENKNGLGFHIPGKWDKVLDINKCWLQADPSNSIRNAVKDFANANKLSFFDLREQNGFLRTLMIRTSSSGEIMVLIQFYEDHADMRERLLDHLQHRFPEITSLLYVINTKANDTLYDQNVVCYHGRDYILENMEGLSFKINAKSFYQTNSKQALELYKVAREFAALSGTELVYDLYTGTGTIAQFVSKQAHHVVGIESVPDAIEAAKENAQLNAINNVSFFVGDMKNMLNEDFINANGKPDVVITDPPRDGMHKDVVKQLLKIAPNRIVYVSCNSATQARDLALMSAKYDVKKVQPVDMFPHTHHVENVVLLEKR